MTLPGAPRPLGFLPPTPSTNSPFSTTRWVSSTMSRMASSKVSATPLDAPRRPESVQTGVDQRRSESDTRGKRPAGEWGWGVATGHGGAHSGTPEAEAAIWRERERDGVEEMLIDEWRPRFAARQANVQLSSRASQSYEHRQYDPETRGRADSTFSRLLPHLLSTPAFALSRHSSHYAGIKRAFGGGKHSQDPSGGERGVVGGGAARARSGLSAGGFFATDEVSSLLPGLVR